MGKYYGGSKILFALTLGLVPGTLGATLLEMRMLGNLAGVQSDQGKFADAQRNAERALRLSADPDAADWRPFVYGTLAKIAYVQIEERQPIGCIRIAEPTELSQRLVALLRQTYDSTPLAAPPLRMAAAKAGTSTNER